MPRFDPVDYALHYGARCRDCADSDGVCPQDGTPCDPDIERAVVRRTLDAWRYGIANGYMDNPFGDLIDAVRAQARREALEEAARIADGWVGVVAAHDVGAPLDRIKCSVGTMTTSAGTDYFVVLKNGDREITPGSHRILGRAQYDADHWKWFFGQLDEEPDILEYDTDGDDAGEPA